MSVLLSICSPIHRLAYVLSFLPFPPSLLSFSCFGAFFIHFSFLSSLLPCLLTVCQFMVYLSCFAPLFLCLPDARQPFCHSISISISCAALSLSLSFFVLLLYLSLSAYPCWSMLVHAGPCWSILSMLSVLSGPCIYQSACLPACLPVCLSLSVCLSVRLSVCPSVFLSVRLSANQSTAIRLSTSWQISLPTSLPSIYPSIYLRWSRTGMQFLRKQR